MTRNDRRGKAGRRAIGAARPAWPPRERSRWAEARRGGRLGLGGLLRLGNSETVCVGEREAFIKKAAGPAGGSHPGVVMEGRLVRR